MARNLTPMTPDDLRSKIADSRQKSFRIGMNAYWTNKDGILTLTLHWTEIVRIFPDNTVTLDTNSWHTLTTSRYMNCIKGIQTHLKKEIIHVSTPDGDLPVNPTITLSL